MSIVYHYTPGRKIGFIIQSGELRPSSMYLLPGERGTVSFSTRSTWEPTSSGGASIDIFGKRHLITMEESDKIYGGLYRIAVSGDGLIRWGEWRKSSGASCRMIKHLEDEAIRQGSNVGYYRMTYDSVPMDKWLAVERWVGAQWVSLAKSEIKVIQEGQAIRLAPAISAS